MLALEGPHYEMGFLTLAARRGNVSSVFFGREHLFFRTQSTEVAHLGLSLSLDIRATTCGSGLPSISR
jgi:hypothetical protein